MRRVVPWLDAVAFLVFGAFVLTRWTHNIRYLSGVGLAVCGFTLWMLARRQLGDSFSARAQARRLVTTGLYSKIRHPVYVFGELAFVGLFIAWGNPFGLLYVLTIPIEAWRARTEEVVLEKAFGDEYRRWKAGTWF